MIIFEFGFWFLVVFLAVACGTAIFRFICLVIVATLEIIQALITIRFVKEILQFFIDIFK